MIRRAGPDWRVAVLVIWWSARACDQPPGRLVMRYSSGALKIRCNDTGCQGQMTWGHDPKARFQVGARRPRDAWGTQSCPKLLHPFHHLPQQRRPEENRLCYGAGFPLTPPSTIKKRSSHAELHQQRSHGRRHQDALLVDGNFLVKAAIAAIPAVIILSVVASVVMSLLAGFFGGPIRHF